MHPTLNTWWLWITVDDLGIERQQLKEEGRDFARLNRKLEHLRRIGNEKLSKWENQEKAQALLDDAQALPTVRDYPFREPSSLPEIKKLRPSGPRRFAKRLSDTMLRDRIHAGWLGRCAGCLVGKPFEGTRSWAMADYLKETGQWPLSAYPRFDGKGKKARAFQVFMKNAFLREFMKTYDALDHMPIDDDTNYTTAGLMIVKQKGPDFTPADVAHFWMQRIPLEATCTAERVAYRNLAMNIAPPDSAAFRNPYREWIGAQIRADAFGYVNAGNPERAAEFAWRDASISHIKNGIYGEMLMAACIAAAPYCDSAEGVLRTGLSEIPKTSRLHARVSDVFEWHKQGLSYDDAVQRIHDQWNENSGHDWCHTISNAVICAVALLWSEDDFGTAICRAVMPGYDTDCNGATVGSIFGMLKGTRAISKHWTAKLHNTLKTSLSGYETVKIDTMARDTFELCKRIR